MAYSVMYGFLELVTWAKACSGDYVSQEPP